MTMNKFGFNIQFAQVANSNECLNRLNQYKPAWNLTYSVNDANEIRKRTGGNVIVRLFPDGGVNEKNNLAWFINKYRGVAEAGHWIEVTNEYISVSWLKIVLPAVLAMGWKICAPAFATGTPEPADWLYSFVFMLRLAAQYPNNFRFSVHEYMPVSPFNMILGSEFTFSSNLPGPTWYYNGRFEQFAYPVCAKLGLPLPRYVVTEAGGANQRGSRSNIQVYSGGWTNGFKAYEAYYEKQFPGLTGAQIYAKLNTWLVDNFYDRSGSLCDGYILYCYDDDRNLPKNSQNDWSGFAVANEPDFWAEYDAWFNSKQGEVSVPTPPNENTEVWFDCYLTASGTVPTRIRKTSGPAGEVVGSIPVTRTAAYVNPIGTKNEIDGVWLNVSVNGVIGFSRNDVVILEKK